MLCLLSASGKGGLRYLMASSPEVWFGCMLTDGLHALGRGCIPS